MDIYIFVRNSIAYCLLFFFYYLFQFPFAVEPFAHKTLKPVAVPTEPPTEKFSFVRYPLQKFSRHKRAYCLIPISN